MKNSIKYHSLFLAIVLFSCCLAACSNDKDEPYDSSNPMVGTWECIAYDDVDMCFPDSWSWSSLNDFWEKEFKKEWMGRKIKIAKDAVLEDGCLWLSRGEHPDGQLYADDEEYLYNIEVSVDGKTMTANLHDKETLTLGGDEWVKFRGMLTFKRK